MSATQSTAPAKASQRRNKKPKTTQLLDVMSLPAEREALKAELVKRIIVEAPYKGSVPNSNPPISFCKLGISIKNTDGTEGDLVVAFDRCFSFGTSESRAPDTKALNGYSATISMYDREGATELQTRTVLFIQVLADVLKDHLLTDECKDAMEMWDFDINDLKKMDGLYYKKDKGKIIEGSPPTFYPKLTWFKESEKNGKTRPAKMLTKYYLEDEVDENGEPVEANPLDFIGVRHFITPAVKFETVYMATKTKNMQVKVYEADVKAAETGPKRLLRTGARAAPAVSVSAPKSDSKLEVKEAKVEVKVESKKVESAVAAVTAPANTAASIVANTASTDAPADDATLQASDDEDEKEKKKKVRKVKVKAAEKK